MTKMKILLADDDEDDRMFFEEALQELKLPTDITTVGDGIELIEFLKNNPDYAPHILFLDINMPRMNGIEALKELRMTADWKNFVVAIYSTSNAEADIEETFVQGANIYINKPNDFKVLKNTLEEVVNMNWQFHTSGLNKDTFLLKI